MYHHGEEFYGQVDRVPHETYVTTKFLHVAFVPLIPLGSYRINDGSEDGDHPTGVRIPLSWKSIAVGYMRGWSGGAAVFACVLVMSTVTQAIVFSLGLIAWLAIVGAVAGSIYLVLRSRDWWWLPALAALWLVTGWWWFDVVAVAESNPRDADPDIVKSWPLCLIGNGALVLYSLTRWFTHAANRAA